MSKPIVDADGNRRWFRQGAFLFARGADGELHRVDGPAIEWANGSKTWCHMGEAHRDGGFPAIEFGGYKAWWVDGKFVRSRDS